MKYIQIICLVQVCINYLLFVVVVAVLLTSFCMTTLAAAQAKVLPTQPFPGRFCNFMSASPAAMFISYSSGLGSFCHF